MFQKYFIFFLSLLCTWILLVRGEEARQSVWKETSYESKRFIDQYLEEIHSDAKTIKDFEIHGILAESPRSVVKLASCGRGGEMCAMKVVNFEKRMKEKHDLRSEFLNEVRALRNSNSNFIVKLQSSFWDAHKGYLIFEFLPAGDFAQFLKKKYNNEPMPEAEARFYAANMVMAILYLQSHNMVHRDIKPANFLIGNDGFLLLADFGECSYVYSASSYEEMKLYRGTPLYMAPEIKKCQGNEVQVLPYTNAVDWWSFGIVVLEMLAGRSQVEKITRNLSLEKLKNTKIDFPRSVSKDAKSFVRELLNWLPDERLGATGENRLLKHPFFHGKVKWQKFKAKKVDPPYLPKFKEEDPTKLDSYLKNNKNKWCSFKKLSGMLCMQKM